jgi:hypothetical protein
VKFDENPGKAKFEQTFVPPKGNAYLSLKRQYRPEEDINSICLKHFGDSRNAVISFL